MIFSENRFPLFWIMLRPKSSGSKWLPVPQPRVGRGVERQRESLIGVAWGARPKPGPDSPANVSKRGLSARNYVPNQTLIMVNARLPKGNLAAGNQGGPGGYGSWNRVLKGSRAPDAVQRDAFRVVVLRQAGARSLGPGAAAHRCRSAAPRPGHERWAFPPAQIPDPAAQCARVMRQPCPSKDRGRRESRVRAAPAVSCAICAQEHAHEHTGSAEASGLPCAMVLRLIARSPRRTGFLATVAPEKPASRELDASIGASGPHAFAVRLSAVRQRHIRVHRISTRVS
jgi:hypothetical protein